MGNTSSYGPGTPRDNILWRSVQTSELLEDEFVKKWTKRNDIDSKNAKERKKLEFQQITSAHENCMREKEAALLNTATSKETVAWLLQQITTPDLASVDTNGLESWSLDCDEVEVADHKRRSRMTEARRLLLQRIHIALQYYRNQPVVKKNSMTSSADIGK